MKKVLLYAGIVSAAAVAILGGAGADAIAAPSQAAASATVAREYGSTGFSQEEATQLAQQSLADGERNLHITCVERSISVTPLVDSIWGTWEAVIKADCSG